MKLMVIEDDHAVAACLRELFELAGHSCDTYTAPREGVRAYKIGGYDVVFTDIKMPGMNGLEVLETLRSRDPRACVIIMTGYADLENAIGAVNAGAYAFFRKPLEVERIKSCLKRIEREKELERRDHDLGEELVKLCIELKDFEDAINTGGRHAPPQSPKI